MKATKHYEKHKNNRNHRNLDSESSIDRKLNRRSTTKIKHIHIFKARIAFDSYGNDYAYGQCECGERDM